MIHKNESAQREKLIPHKRKHLIFQIKLLEKGMNSKGPVERLAGIHFKPEKGKEPQQRFR
jgi:hypothetical protein